MDLAPEVVSRLTVPPNANQDLSIVIMPVEDQTLEGLGVLRASILSALKDRVSRKLGVPVADEVRFDRWMDEQGPGSGEYWILPNERSDAISTDQTPKIILVPVCITSQEEDSILYHLELKSLELHSCRYTKAVAQLRRKAEQDPPGVPGR